MKKTFVLTSYLVALAMLVLAMPFGQMRFEQLYPSTLTILDEGYQEQRAEAMKRVAEERFFYFLAMAVLFIVPTIVVANE